MLTPNQAQRGAALFVTIILLFVLALMAAFANRNLLFGQRSSVNQYRSTQAFEAAEAGIEWAVAMLNNGQRLRADCLPGDAADDRSFRERYLGFDAVLGRHVPATWNDGSTVTALGASCVQGAQGWSCSCPSSGHPSLVVPTEPGAHPAFSIQFSAEPHAGLLRLTAIGCTSLGGPCTPGSNARSDSSARVQVTLGLVPGLGTSPTAPLSVKGSMDVATAALSLHNPDAASGGLTVHAGGGVSAPNASVTTVPGGSTALSVVERDAALAALTTQQLFATYFRLDKAAWRDQSAVTRMVCAAPCGVQLAAAIGPRIDHRLVWVDGDLEMEGPITLGTPDRPVMLVASGAVRLTGSVVIHGLVYGADVRWNGSAGALHGAAISEGDYRGDGTPNLIYDAAVLDSLKHRTGSFARVPGSWRDF
jgi:Tfp pilus assembly protein PilX